MSAPVRPARSALTEPPLAFPPSLDAPAYQGPGALMDDRGFQGLVERWLGAVRGRAANRLSGLHVPGAVLQGPDGSPVRGPREIRAFWTEWFARPRFSLAIEDLETHFYPAAGVGVGNGPYLLWTHGPGGRRADQGRLLIVGVRSGGRWGIRFNAFFSESYLRELSSLHRMAS